MSIKKKNKEAQKEYRRYGLGFDFGVEADELLVVKTPVAVKVVASNQFDRLIHAEAELTL